MIESYTSPATSSTLKPSPGSEAHLVGQTDVMRLVEQEIDCAARADAKVLITGETGTGKEIVARMIHQRGPRSSRPLVTMNCAGLPDSLLESELFGYVRGAFTDAYRDKVGLLELAHTGTVFLDEVGEMSLRMQVALLRFLENGEIQRIGSTRASRRVDVRLIAATNRDLHEQVASGAFREDFYYRLNVMRIAVPPLRDRVEDVPLLVARFSDTFSRHHGVPEASIEPPVMDLLKAYRWPGNVRELRNVIERLILKAAGRPVRPDDLPEHVRRSTTLSGGRVAQEPIPRRSGHSVAEELCTRMLRDRESFWAVVRPAFMSRDLTREDVRTMIATGLEISNGNYRVLTRLFGMADQDCTRFLAFLKKYDCHVPPSQTVGERETGSESGATATR